MNFSHTHSQRQRRQKRNLKSETPTLLQYIFLLIVCLNTLIISFLSLFQHNVAITRSGGLERMLRHKSLAPPTIQASQVKVVGSYKIAAVINNTTIVSKTLDLKCKDHRAWTDDLIWRDAVLHPTICSRVNDIPNSVDEQAYKKEQLDLLNATLYSSNADFTPCGAYCLYHLDSAYSYQYGHPIFGWVLRVYESKENETISKHGCWQPFSSENEDSACVIYYYNDWIGYVEDVEVKQRKLPDYDEHSVKDSHVNPKAIRDQMEEHQPKCSLGGEPIDSFYTSSTSPFCSFRSYDGGNSLSMRILKNEDHSGLEFRKNLKPSEIVHLFDRYQLGIDDLSDALTSMTETFTHLKSSSCNAKDQPEQLLLCVYHRHSTPRTVGVAGQYGSKVPIKGWQYRTLDRCFIPVESMEHSSTCGRSSEQYKTWSHHMLELEQKKSLAKLPEKKESKLSKCDRLPLLLGRNAWDSDADEYVYLPPLPTTGAPAHGATYSEGSVCGPRLLIVGAAKCGTNAIATLLSHHPRVKIDRCHENKKNCDHDHFAASDKILWENHGLSHSYVEDRHNYASKYAQKLPVTEDYDYLHFPNGTSVVGRGSLTFDHSPSYLNTEIFPNIANRAKQLLPNAKVVVSLCNPVERMYTEFHDETLTKFRMYFDLFFINHNVPVPKDFTEMIHYMKFSAEICYSKPVFCDELRRDMLRTGLFHENVRSWRNAFGAENVLVLDMDESSEDKMKKITSLMGDYLPENEYPWEKMSSISIRFSKELYSHKSGSVEQNQAFDWLRGYFFRHNVALAEEIDAEWPLRWNKKPTE